MKILASGSTGFIGQPLVDALRSEGHEVARLRRSVLGRDADPGDCVWDPERRVVAPEQLEGFQAVIHLAGEGLGTGRWSRRKKSRILSSRVQGTRLLSEALARLSRPPEVFVSASAVSYYGDRGDELLDEESPPGKGFLAGVCREWEKATETAKARGIRVVNLRIGVTLSPSGGALAQLLPRFRAGTGAVLGSGRQYISWISLVDLLGVILYVIENASFSGPVNAVAPQPATSEQLTRALAALLDRPVRAAVPPFVLRLAYGEAAQELLLGSTRALPRKLMGAGYNFRHPKLELALRELLESPKLSS